MRYFVSFGNVPILVRNKRKRPALAWSPAFDLAPVASAVQPIGECSQERGFLEAGEIPIVFFEDSLQCLGTFPWPDSRCKAELDVFQTTMTEWVHLDCCEPAVPRKIARVRNPDDLQKELKEGPADFSAESEADLVLPAEA